MCGQSSWIFSHRYQGGEWIASEDGAAVDRLLLQLDPTFGLSGEDTETCFVTGFPTQYAPWEILHHDEADFISSSADGHRSKNTSQEIDEIDSLAIHLVPCFRHPARR